MRANNLTLIFILTVLIMGSISPARAQPASEQHGEKATYISGQVTAADNGPITGLVVIEKGRLYGKDFRYGGLIKSDGSFSVKVNGGGNYGLHLYATGYIYFPLSIDAVEGQDNRATYSLPPNAAKEDGPIISDIEFKATGDETLISLSAHDPNNNLSHQVLAVNTATGEGLRLKPPGIVFPWTRNYPQGTYTYKYPISGDEKAINPENWHFVAADNKCYNSPVLGYPFTRDGVLHARSSASSINTPGTAPPSNAPLHPAASGTDVYRNNCSICHYSDSTRTKVGPGLEGIFKRKTAPAQGFPVNDQNIRNQILKGGAEMPPYAHLSEEQVNVLMVYLKTL